MAKINPIDFRKALKSVSYPAETSDLVKAPKKNGASDLICGALDQLDDTTFETPADVTEDIVFGRDGESDR